MKILVTGGLGTLGAPLVQHLREHGNEVWTVDQRHHENPQHIRADVADWRQIERALGEANPECVYHLAAEFGRKNGEDFVEQCWRTGAIGTKNILRLQESAGFKMIHASSSEVYGEVEADVILESHALGKSLAIPRNDYALSKWVNEAQIINHQETTGNKVTRLRFFNAYGPGEYYHRYRSVVALFCYSALHDLPVTVFRGYRRVFMFIDDFIPTLGRAAHLGPHAPDVMNVGGVDYRSVEELWEIVERNVPSTRSRVEYLEVDQHNVTNKRPDISRAQDHLRHKPSTEIPEGVARTIEWMRSVYPGARESSVTYVREAWRTA